MGKATATDIIAAGFRAEQFGGGAAFEGDLLPKLLTHAELWARAELGEAAYTAAASDAATTAAKLAQAELVKAETEYVAAELWRTRATHLDSAAAIGSDFGAYLERREMYVHADAAQTRAEAALQRAGARLGVTLAVATEGSAIAVGHVETGLFPAHSAAAVTA
jgi:hypothetical protein